MNLELYKKTAAIFKIYTTHKEAIQFELECQGDGCQMPHFSLYYTYAQGLKEMQAATNLLKKSYALRMFPQTMNIKKLDIHTILLLWIF